MKAQSTSGGHSMTALTLSKTQEGAVDYLYEHDHGILIAPTGVGKTAIALKALEELINDEVISRCIIVAPAKVTTNWLKESDKWGSDLTLAVGTGAKSIKLMVNDRLAPQVMVTSYESLPLLLESDHGADAILYDELTRLKDSGGKVAKCVRKHTKDFQWRFGMTATPLSESWEACFGMCLPIDGGKRFGRNKKHFYQQYFIQTDYQGYKFEVRADAIKELAKKLAGISYIVGEEVKRESLSDVHHENIPYLPPISIVELQDKIAKDYIVEVDDGVVEAANAGVVSGKLRQLSQGFIYGDELEDGVKWLTTERLLICLHEMIHTVNRWGSVVVTYEYTPVMQRLCDMANFHIDVVNGDTSKDKFDEIMKRWRSGQGEVMLLQVKAGSHGLDGLQNSCHNMIHYAPIWSRDATMQLEGRLDRTGQTMPVHVKTIIGVDTIDEIISQRVVDKGSVFKAFIDEYRKKM